MIRHFFKKSSSAAKAKERLQIAVSHTKVDNKLVDALLIEIQGVLERFNIQPGKININEKKSKLLLSVDID